MGNQVYQARFLVTDSLVAPVIIGNNILQQHSVITLEFNGDLKETTFCQLATNTLQCQTYRLLPGVEIEQLNPISIQSRPDKHMEFIKAEIHRY